MKFSIIIPTRNHCEDFLVPCLASIEKYTDLTSGDIEVIVVANGCTDQTKPFLALALEENSWLKVLWYTEPLGYPLANNVGIAASSGEYVILLNNDTVLQDQGKNYWLELLESPFLRDPKVGITGPVVFSFDCGGIEYDCVAFWLACIKREVIDNIGGLDEAFSPGMGEDGDFCIRASKAGYTFVSVPQDSLDRFGSPITNMGFPIHHVGNGTFNDEQFRNTVVAKNKALLAQRYGIQTPTMNKPKYSIVIPSYNHWDDLLKPCLDSIVRYSDMSQLEVIVVANGCTDQTRDGMTALAYPSDSPFKMVWSDESLGYTKATNLGIQAATGEFIVLLNNDTEVLQSEKNRWLDWLAEPFADPTVGITGPLELFDNYSNHHVMIFFCVMVRATVFKEIGLLDEIYSPGGGEDIEFTIRAKKAGYKSMVIAPTDYNGKTNVGMYPIWHKDNRTFVEMPEYTKVIVKRNGLLNCQKFNDNIKLNLGGGGVNYPGFLSVDMNDQRAHILMDITKLEFQENTVSEIMASHVFEHLNPYKAVDILKSWLKVLKPGGKLTMEMPDIVALCKKIAKAYDEDDMKNFYGPLNAVYGSVNTTDVGEPSDITSPHLFGWAPKSLFYHMLEAGYVDITFGPEQWPHPEHNFRVEAYKPAVAIDQAYLQQQDPVTYTEIFTTNSYKVAREEIRGKTVIDIGANIGMFSLLCASFGASKVIAVEAQSRVFQGLLDNISGYQMITPIFKAAYSTDGGVVFLENNNVASKVGTAGDAVETRTLATILYEQNIIGDDLVLKLDCEGAEFDVLMSSTDALLKRFKTIYMEVHEKCNPNPNLWDSRIIDGKLAGCGFDKVHRYTCQGYDEARGGTFDLGIYVDKWVRK